MARTMVRHRRSMGHTSRRGLAMMLVVIALAVGTVIAGVALTSRSVAPELGANAQSASQAKWSAQSAAEYAVAALETNIDLASITDGAMMSSFEIAGGKVQVSVTDLEGNPPTADTRELLVTTSASVNGIPSVVRKRVVLEPPPTAPVAVDPYLSEFALFAQDGLTINAGAAIGKWNKSPEARGAEPLKIGLGFANLANVNIHAGSRISGSALYVDATASASLRSVLNSNKFSTGTRLDIDVPVRHVSTPSTVSSLPAGGASSFTYTTGKTTFPTALRYTGALVVQDNAIVVLDEAVSPGYSFGGIIVNRGGTLVIRGDVDVEVNGPVYALDKSRIMLEDDSRLDLFVRGSVYVQKSAIGGRGATADAAGFDASSANYNRPDVIRIMSPASSYANQTFVIDDRSLVVASIHMPAAAMTLDKESTLAGRASAKSITVNAACCVYADTALDNRRGLTNTKGPLYDENGNLISGVVNLLTGVLAVLNAGKTAEQIVADINANANAGLPVAEAPIDGTTARTTRSTRTIDVPVASMVMERRATLARDAADEGDDEDEAPVRVSVASDDDQDD